MKLQGQILCRRCSSSLAVKKRWEAKSEDVSIDCSFCLKTFKVKYADRDREFCSKSCSSRGAIKASPRKNTSTCVVCNTEFEHYGSRILCGRKCQAKYMSKTRIGEGNPDFIENKEIVSCENCGKKTSLSRCGVAKGHKEIFCSRSCCSKFFVKNKVEFRKTRNLVLERDSYTCCLCGKQKTELEHSLEVHHIDYNRHNNHDDNLISLCNRCHLLTNYERTMWQILFGAVLSGSKLVSKGWGIEVWITNTPEYCLKYLIFFAGKKFSIHSHKLKKELWHCLLGKFDCTVSAGGVTEKFTLSSGDKIELDRGTIHQLSAVKNSFLVEVSTRHYDEDSYRIQKGD